MKKEDANVFKTTNFHIAVWLMMNNILLKEIAWSETNKRRAEFVFEDFEDRDTLVNDFFKQKQIQDYISNSQELKARMYATHSPEVYDRDN
jgi:hypothetical protein